MDSTYKAFDPTQVMSTVGSGGPSLEDTFDGYVDSYLQNAGQQVCQEGRG